MEEIVTRYGLFAVLVLAAVEGDVTLILAGVVSHLGIFNLLPAICVGTIGAFAGDCVWYWVGRSNSTSIRRSRLYRRMGDRAEQLARRFGVWGILQRVAGSSPARLTSFNNCNQIVTGSH